MSGLLREKRFAPFFWTQFLGAFNDNVFKNALVITVSFKAASESAAGSFANIAAGLFILPFFLLSPLAGQFSDKFDKGFLIRRVKACEIPIMLMAAVGFYCEWWWFLTFVVFLMGAQSTFFGPVKYSILPQHLEADEIMHGTSMVEMGTFMAILMGTIAGGLLADSALAWVGLVVVALAVGGWVTALFIPEAPPSAPNLQIRLNPMTEYKELWGIINKQRAVFLSVLGISWFWFLGAVVLAQLTVFVKHTLGGEEFVATCLLATFTLSIAVGSIVSDLVSDKSVELGLVPLGTFGMSVAMIDLGIRDYSLFSSVPLTTAYLQSHYLEWPIIRIFLDFFVIGVSSSFFIVPLYALLQHRSEPAECSRVIAGNNILNAVFMVAAAAFAVVLGQQGLTTPEIVLVSALMNIAVAAYMCLLLPEFILRLGLWLMAKTIYKLRYHGRQNIPRHGACVLVCNHVSFIDWFVITAACQRPVRFVMYHKIFKIPVLQTLFKLTHAIPIAPAKEDPIAKERAFEQISADLEAGEIVCIFPEGMITHDGNINSFRPGVEQILQANPVPVVPMAIGGLWGSFFSRKGGAAMKKIPKPRRRQITVEIGAAQQQPQSAQTYQELVTQLWEKADGS